MPVAPTTAISTAITPKAKASFLPVLRSAMRLMLDPGVWSFRVLADLLLRELEDLAALEALLVALVHPRLPHLDRAGDEASAVHGVEGDELQPLRPEGGDGR